ncbi:MAG: hypothetical protein HYX74_06415 [Acidobacteria bacterium]|nr:hypothetical protein [Acidobacteriota bacterium]
MTLDTAWWIGFALSLLGLILLLYATVFNAPFLPARFRSYVFWLAFLMFFMGLSLAVVFI